MGAVELVEENLKSLPEELANSPEAAVARAMAEVMDGQRKGSISECGKVLLQAQETLRALAPPKREKDGIDDLAERRAKRRDGLAEAAHLPHS